MSSTRTYAVPAKKVVGDDTKTARRLSFPTTFAESVADVTARR